MLRPNLELASTGSTAAGYVATLSCIFWLAAAHPPGVGQRRLIRTDSKDGTRPSGAAGRVGVWDQKKPGSCVYDVCAAVHVSGASDDGVNGDYYPANKDCSSADYGNLTAGAQWVAYRHPTKDASLVWRWDDSWVRGWGIHRNGYAKYVDALHRRLPSSVVIDFYRPHGQGSSSNGDPRVDCVETSQIRGLRPLLLYGSASFVTFSGQHHFDGLTYFDLADKAPTALGGAFSVAFTAQWDPPQNRSCALDFGSGDRDNSISICSTGTDVQFSVFKDAQESRLTLPNVLQPGRTRRWLFTTSSHGLMRAWRDGAEVGHTDDGTPASAVWRSTLYVGRSLCEDDKEFFKGTMEDLHIWSGEALQWAEQSVLAPI